MTDTRIQRGFLLLLVIGISALFLAMVRGFLVGLILAGAFAAMSRPAFLALAARLGDRRRLAAMLTVLGLVLVILGPLAGFVSLVVAQAADVASSAGPWIEAHAGDWDRLTAWARGLPAVGGFVPDDRTVVEWASQLAGRAGSLVLANARAATAGTLNAVLQMFVALYALYFFLTDGPAILGRILYYAPLDEADERRLVGQFVSVTRATIKGSLLVALIQGALAGAAFFVLQ
ncbi:MAG: AI-2E family transporter, partial [Gemmatimonadota bacterium]|nr:AI-2E family transporter [Gemmatimonadota bacterium]